MFVDRRLGCFWDAAETCHGAADGNMSTVWEQLRSALVTSGIWESVICADNVLLFLSMYGDVHIKVYYFCEFKCRLLIWQMIKKIAIYYCTLRIIFMQIYINDILFVKTAMCNLVEQNSWLLCLIPRLSNTNDALVKYQRCFGLMTPSWRQPKVSVWD